MKKNLTLFILGFILTLINHSYLVASERTETALTLLEASGARPAALGEAFVAAQNDISAFHYNPASLDTLQAVHASFLFQDGISDDSFGQLAFGAPLRGGSLGMSVGYYDGGDIVVNDGQSVRNVVAQQDLVLSLGWASTVGPVTLGLAGKYLSSELAETDSASVWAGDAGLQWQAQPRLNVGFAIQNVGNELRFNEIGDDLPRVARTGVSYLLIPSGFRTNLLLDVPYFFNQKEFQPAVGVETYVGPLAFRAGYKNGSDLEEFSLGTGFILGGASLDYAFGLVDELDSRHRVSLAIRYGSRPSNNPAFVNRNQPNQRTVTEASTDPNAIDRKYKIEESGTITFSAEQNRFYPKKLKKKQLGGRVYEIKPGDTLRKIAAKQYGHSSRWRDILYANPGLKGQSKNLTTGQRIILP